MTYTVLNHFSNPRNNTTAEFDTLAEALDAMREYGGEDVAAKMFDGEKLIAYREQGQSRIRGM